MGLPGTAGTCALARILSGEVNPSGRLADTWTKDHMAAPACNNFQILKDSGDWNEKSWHLDNYKENQGYVIHYEEGIYVGYRYFETRYRTDPDYRYEDEVLFPFGYGLSYTSFRQQITGFCQEGDELILKVRVENIRDIRINGVAKPEGFGLENPAVSWKVDQTESTEQRKSRIRLCSSEKGTLCWEKEGTLDPLGEKIECELKPRTDYHLCITVWGNRGDQAEGEMDFCTGKMGEPWQAEWIGTRSEDHFHPVFEKRFSARKNEIRDAKLYICGLGLFEAYVNGRKAGKEYLAPYYNNYKYEQQIMTFDVTELLSEENTLEVFLGNGWYKGRFAMNQKEIYGDRFALTAELYIRYADGSEQVILTDETWEYRGSDIQESDIYDGETINRLLWKEGTDNPIRKAQILTMSKEGLTDRYSLPVLVKERIPVKEVIHTPAGETVLDMGQNFAGWMEFRSSLPRGTKIVLDFGEVLQEGNFYNANYRTAKSRFVYVSDGRNFLGRTERKRTQYLRS